VRVGALGSARRRGHRIREIVGALAVAGLLTTGLVVISSSAAQAAAAKPETDWSYYMLDGSSSNAYTLGCNQGDFDADHNSNSMAYLDFGGQNSSGSGTLEINDNSVSNATIEAMAENFAIGYYICTGADTTTVLDMSIGTNNSYDDVSTAGGRTWAAVVHAVQDSTDGEDAAPQVYILGGSDIENFGQSDPGGTLDWTNGFNDADVSLYLDYGSADGCPESTHSNSPACNGGYTQYDYWYMGWGNPSAVADPQIYANGTQQEWTMISYYGYSYQGGNPIEFWAPQDEYDLNSSTYSSSTAWTDFWNELNTYSATADTPPFSNEIHDE